MNQQSLEPPPTHFSQWLTLLDGLGNSTPASSLMHGVDGGVTKISGVMESICEEPLAPSAWAESEQLFRKLVQTSSDAITLLDARGTVLFSNDGLAGRDVFRAIHPDDVSYARRMFAELVCEPEKPVPRTAPASLSRPIVALVRYRSDQSAARAWRAGGGYECARRHGSEKHGGGASRKRTALPQAGRRRHRRYFHGGFERTLHLHKQGW